MRYVVSAMLLIAGLIHIPPLAGVLGSERLAALYGIEFAEPNLILLMRHRAVMLGMVGALMIVAAFRPAWQGVALRVGFASTMPFLVLAGTSGDYNAAIARIVTADVIAVACLLIAAVLLRANPKAPAARGLGNVG